MAKDKQAARAKAKRRAAKTKEEHQAAERLLHDVHEEQKKRGIKPTKVSGMELLRMYNKSARDATVKAIMYGVVAGMIYLHEECGYGKERLLKFAEKCKEIITVIGTNERSVKQLIDDLAYENIDVYEFSKLVKNDMCQTVGKLRQSELGMIYEKIIVGVVAVLYTLYHYYGWRKKRIAKVGVHMAETLNSNFQNDNMTDMIWHLYGTTGVKVELDGQIKIDERSKDK